MAVVKITFSEIVMKARYPSYPEPRQNSSMESIPGNAGPLLVSVTRYKGHIFLIHSELQRFLLIFVALLIIIIGAYYYIQILKM